MSVQTVNQKPRADDCILAPIDELEIHLWKYKYGIEPKNDMFDEQREELSFFGSDMPYLNFR